MRRQLRSFYAQSPAKYDHTVWQDHVLRVEHSAALLREMNPETVADLSCGDGALVELAGLMDVDRAHLGDLAEGWAWPYRGPIEQTIHQIPPVDVFVCTETLEHVEDPDGLLVAIRGKARRLLLSTPVGESDDSNIEHFWGWDAEDLDEMLAAAGWTERQVDLFEPFEGAYYTYQVWRCA